MHHRRLVGFELHIHVLLRHQHVGGLAGNIRDQYRAAARSALHVHTHVVWGEVDFAVHFMAISAVS